MVQLGIDVSKKTLDLCLLREGVKGRIKTRRLKNDFNAASAVIGWLVKQQCEPADVHILMEAMAVYHESLAYGLYKAGARVSLAYPNRSRELARGMDILTKNDQVDAYRLACYGALKEPEPWIPPPEDVRYLSALYVAVMHLSPTASVKKTGLKNSGQRTVLLRLLNPSKMCSVT